MADKKDNEDTVLKGDVGTAFDTNDIFNDVLRDDNLWMNIKLYIIKIYYIYILS